MLGGEGRGVGESAHRPVATVQHARVQGLHRQRERVRARHTGGHVRMCPDHVDDREKPSAEHALCVQRGAGLRAHGVETEHFLAHGRERVECRHWRVAGLRTRIHESECSHSVIDVRTSDTTVEEWTPQTKRCIEKMQLV